MKKLNVLCLFLTCVLLFGNIFGVAVCANTLDNPVLLCTGDSYIVDGDDYVAVPIRVKNNDDGFFSVVFDVMFNPQILTYKTCVSKDFIVTEGGEYSNSVSSTGKTFVVEHNRVSNYKKTNSDVAYLIFKVNGEIPYTGFAPVQVFDPIVGVGSVDKEHGDACDVYFCCGESGVLSFCVVGDANDDDFVNMKDVLMMRKIIADFDNLTYSFRASDMDSSLSIDLKDVLLLRKMIAESAT